ncbi:nuclear transport factor 2 family protein [Tenggerimyces flavus]|uniref:Nuclear transport factor 2 family protein n=1 Tax=Tenggerimyces flavus TaxID=1708749 RepID=A0ABV7YB46_9ACTN|nr:nuclear transport factor 2 family protein [Tenggerimyces flavus]MBM7787029.1 hypothetical protein [Tenggerimyces flavus]
MTPREVLQTIAAAWCSRPADAAAYFTEDALYLEPPDKQRYVGRAALAEFFGEEPLRMEWHGLAYDEASRTAYGEYTFRGGNQYHGVVIATFRNGLVASWREYQYESDLPFEDFASGQGRS